MLFNNRFESSVEISSQNGLSRKLTRLFDWVLIILSLIGFSFIILYGAIAQGKAPDSKQLHQHLSKEEINRLTVDPISQVIQKNIENHIIALAGQRYTKKEKTKTTDYISKTLESFGYVVQITEGESKNLIADLKGSITPKQIFIVAAHYDTVKNTPGADDNASSVAGMLEVARVLAKTSLASTVRFIAFDNEENELLGSSQYAKSLHNNGAKVIGMISLEMIAYTCKNCQTPFSDIPEKQCLDVEPENIKAGNFIGIIANSDSANMVAAFKNSAASFVSTLDIVSAVVGGNGNCFPSTRRSDHAPFWDQGYPALMITDTANFRNPNYHKSSDTLDTLDLDFATKVVKATLATVVTTVKPVDSRPQR